jgi:hypothetical protein
VENNQVEGTYSPNCIKTVNSPAAIGQKQSKNYNFFKKLQILRRESTIS